LSRRHSKTAPYSPHLFAILAASAKLSVKYTPAPMQPKVLGLKPVFCMLVAASYLVPWYRVIPEGQADA